MSYKWCVVPGCKSTTVKTPEKLFICVPKIGKIRKKWLQLAYRNPNDIVDNSSVFFCEDHFDMEKDMANYRQYKMGFSQRIIMVDGVLPSKFNCQDDLTETTCDDSSSQPIHAKRQKIQVIPNCEDIEPTATAPEGTNDAHEIMDLSLDSDEESTPPLEQDLFCICCLERKVSLISLVSCTHAEFLDHFTTPLMELKSRLLCICCHAFLKKIKIFRQQVTASFKRILWDKTSVNDGKNQKLCKMSLLRLPKIDIDGRTAQPIKIPKAKRKNNKRKYKQTVIKNKLQVEKKETLKSEDKRPIDVGNAKSADEFRENSKNDDSVRRNMETAMNIIKQNEENSITNTIQAITDKSLLDVVNLITTEVLSQEKISLSTQQAEPGDLPMMDINLESTDNGNDGGKLDTAQTETSLFLTDANQSQTETSFFLPDASDSQTATSLFLPSTNQRQLEASLFPQSTSHSQPETRPETSTSQSQLKTSLLPTDSQSQTENRLFLLDTNNSQPETRLLPSTNQSQPVTSLFLPPTSHSQTETSLTISDSKQSQADTRLLPSTSQSQSAKIILATTSQNQIETSPSLPSTSQGQPKTSLFLPSTSQSQPETSLFHPSTSQSQPGNSIFLPSTSRSQIVTSQIQPVTSQSVSETCTLKSKSGHTIEILTVKINKNELLEEREKMATHNKYRHSEYKCEKCIIGFHYHENLIDHMKRKHIHIEGKDSVVCEICSQVVPKTNITNHETMHYTRYECRACHKRFQLFYDVTEHINNH